MASADDTKDLDLYSPDIKGEALLSAIRAAYSEDLEAVRSQRDAMADDLRFAALDQWDEAARQNREKTNRPCLTLDHTMQHVRQVTGDIRLNRPGIRVQPVDDDADPAIARFFTGYIRHIERASDAQRAYVKGAENAAICGQGHWRITTGYAADDVFDQDIRIERIPSALGVVWDRNAIMPVKQDAMHCTVLSRFSMSAFRNKWPKADPKAFERNETEDWISSWYEKSGTGEWVTVAEFWRKVPVKRLLWRSDGAVRDVTDLSKAARNAWTGPEGPDATREVVTHRVMRHLVNGCEELEPAEEWNGRHIPIISTFGEEIHVGDECILRGLIRAIKDAQRTINYHASAVVEVTALAPKAPFVGTPKQVEGYKSDWENANVENKAILLYNPDSAAAGPPQRQPQAEVPAALIQVFQMAIQAMQAGTGFYASGGLGQSGPETSGRAIIARERQGDVGSFLYMDNVGASIAWTAEQLIDLIPRVVDGERILRVLGEDETEEMIRVNAVKIRYQTDAAGNPVLDPLTGQPEPVIDPETGKPEIYIENDLSRGRYDLALSSAKSFSTKRQEAVEVMTELMSRMPPDVVMLMLDIFVKNLDIPGGDELYERLRKMLVSRGVVEPDEEKGEAAPAPPPPSAEELKAQAGLMEAEAKAAKTAAETEQTAAETQGQQIRNMTDMLALALQSGAVQDALSLAAAKAAEDAITGVMAGMQMRNGGGPRA